MDSIEKEKADIGLLTSLSIDIIAASAILTVIERKIAWMLPVRALMLKIICYRVSKTINDKCANAEKTVFNNTHVSVHTLSLAYTVKNQNKNLQVFIKEYNKKLTYEAVVMPCAFTMLLFAIGVILEWL